MKYFKRPFALIAILLVIAILLPACASGKSGETTTAEGAADTPEETRQVKLTIAGADVSDYVIVYANNEYSNVKSSMLKKLIYTEYDFYKLTAISISERIAALTGVTLTVVNEDKAEAVDKEIIVGPSARAESKANKYDDMDVHEYLNNVQGSKLVIGGGHISTALTGNTRTSYCWAATYHAFDPIETYIKEQAASGAESVDIPADFSQSGKADIKTVGMIGDSITEGVGSSNSNICAYPAVMQRLLWQDYVVVNLGNSGKTMRRDLNDRYYGTPQYVAGTKYSSIYDLVFIMLGTNDSNRDRQWTDDDDEKYNDGALEIANNISKKNDRVEFIIMNCPIYYGSDNFGSKHVRELQDALPDLFKADGKTCSFYDMYSFTKKELTKSHFPDSLHPDNEGHNMMGTELARVVTEYFAAKAEQN